MKRKLQKTVFPIHHYVDGKKIEGAPPCVSGNLDGVWGNLTGVRGNLDGVWGNLADVRGDLTGVRGDLDDCELTPEDRAAGVDIQMLIEE